MPEHRSRVLSLILWVKLSIQDLLKFITKINFGISELADVLLPSP